MALWQVAPCFDPTQASIFSPKTGNYPKNYRNNQKESASKRRKFVVLIHSYTSQL